MFFAIFMIASFINYSKVNFKRHKDRTNNLLKSISKASGMLFSGVYILNPALAVITINFILIQEFSILKLDNQLNR